MEDLELLKLQIDYYDQHIKEIKKRRFKRLISFLFFAAMGGYFIILRIGIAFIRVFSHSLWFKSIDWYVRHYFGFYFFWHGIHTYSSKPCPKGITKPTIIFSLRRDTISPFLAYLFFPFPIIIPLTKYFFRRARLLFFPISMRRIFRIIAYEDTTLKKDIENIKTLLKHNYAVQVHINEHYLDPIGNRKLIFQPEFLDLLNNEDYDIYFLNLADVWNYPLATFFTPIFVGYDLITKDKLFENIDTKNLDLVCHQIAQFFGFTEYLFVC